MKPSASIGRFLLIFFAFGAIAAAGGLPVAAWAATPTVHSNRDAIPPHLLAAMARGEAAAATHASRYRRNDHTCVRLPATTLRACFEVDEIASVPDPSGAARARGPNALQPSARCGGGIFRSSANRSRRHVSPIKEKGDPICLS